MEIEDSPFFADALEAGYQDENGKPTTLYRLVRDAPEWAESRLRVQRQVLASLEQRVAAQGERIEKLEKGIRDALDWNVIDPRANMPDSLVYGLCWLVTPPPCGGNDDGTCNGCEWLERLKSGVAALDQAGEAPEGAGREEGDDGLDTV